MAPPVINTANLVFSLSQLKFTAVNGSETLFSFSLVSSGDKVKIESLPPGVLPDKMVIDLRNHNQNISSLMNVLQIYKNKFNSSIYTDLGNDIDYALKELPKFRSRLKIVIDNAASLMSKDMFNNVYAGFDEYKFIELLFSTDFKKIVSVRLLGTKPASFKSILSTFGTNSEENIPQESTEPKRFVIFNIPNEDLDINIVNLVYKSEKIVNEYKKSNSFEYDEQISNLLTNSPPESSYNFVISNFIPAPPIHEKQDGLPGNFGKDLAFLDNLLKDFSPKTYNLLFAENDKFSAMSTKQQLANISRRLDAFNSLQNSPLVTSLSNAKMAKGMKEGLAPFECILMLWDSVFSNLDLCQAIQQISKILLRLGSESAVTNLVRESNLIPLFDSIDSLPSAIRDIIYLNFDNENIGLNLTDALGKIQQYISNLPQPERILKCNDPVTLFEEAKKSGGISAMFRRLKSDYPDYYSDIEEIFNANFSRDALIFIIRSVSDLLLVIDYCNINIQFQLPKFIIPDLWRTFSFDLNKLLMGLICELFSALLDLLISLLENLDRLDEFFSQFIAEDTNVDLWEQYINYALYLILSSGRASTELQTTSNFQTVNALSTSEGRTLVLSLNSETKNPISSNNNSVQPAASTFANNCAESNSTTSARIFDRDTDINYDIPIDKTVVTDALERFLSAQENQETAKEVLNKLKNFTYCKKYDFFTTNDLVDRSSIDALRTISETVPPLFETVATTNATNLSLYNKDNLSSSLRNMFKQIKSVLSTRELTQLINGTYSEEVAAVVRVIAKINFPDLTNKVDPVKYFTMLGKVIGRTTERLDSFKVFGEERPNK